MKLQAIAILIATGILSSCTVGPNYHRPTVQTPQAFRVPEPLPDAQAGSFADLKWWEVFRDEELQDLIRKALEQNYDLRDAVARVEMARANLGITRSDQFPQVGASAGCQFHATLEKWRIPPSCFFRSFTEQKLGAGAA